MQATNDAVSTYAQALLRSLTRRGTTSLTYTPDAAHCIHTRHTVLGLQSCRVLRVGTADTVGSSRQRPTRRHTGKVIVLAFENALPAVGTDQVRGRFRLLQVCQGIRGGHDGCPSGTA